MTQYDRKHSAILEAATRVFLNNGYLGANMDQIAREAGVSKQTIYKHCDSKESLFLSIVAELTSQATETSLGSLPDPEDADDPREYLERYARRELRTLLVPEVIRLRRMVIGEADRFPGVAKSYYDTGPTVGFESIERILRVFERRGLMRLSDPRQAAVDLNWLILADPMNRAMFLGERALPTERELTNHARHAVDLFLSSTMGTAT